jgi:hypothetical protein
MLKKKRGTIQTVGRICCVQFVSLSNFKDYFSGFIAQNWDNTCFVTSVYYFRDLLVTTEILLY